MVLMVGLECHEFKLKYYGRSLALLLDYSAIVYQQVIQQLIRSE
jgi:hypothetical protein